MENTKLMTMKEATKYLGVHKMTLQRWDNSGKLKSVRNTINNYRYYRKEDLDKVFNLMKEEGL